jgi:hypothetical protein
MPAGQSIVGIANIALFELGEDPIASLADPNKRALACQARYDDVRLATLADAPWNCAKKLAQLAASPDVPPFGYANQYPLPADFVRMLRVADQDGLGLGDGRWEVLGPMLMSDLGAPLNTLYIFDLQDPTRFDPKLAQTIGYALALEIAPGIVRDDSRIARIQQKYATRISEAKTISSQQNAPREWDADVLLRSRR